MEQEAFEIDKYESKVSILGLLGYEPTTFSLRHFDEKK
jgi:hypothetical protein